jgi:hypothetical protein
MNIDFYSPTFRNVLLEEVKEGKTKGGLYIPSSLEKDYSERVYKVIKTGKDCIEVKPGDLVYLTRGILPDALDDYFQVMEMQIKGYERHASVPDAPGSQSETSGSSELQKG